MSFVAETSGMLGLRARRRLADRLGAIEGRLEIESEPGRGTTVSATIPCHGLPAHD
jgi:signal transduction histidine kinase